MSNRKAAPSQLGQNRDRVGAQLDSSRKRSRVQQHPLTSRTRAPAAQLSAEVAPAIRAFDEAGDRIADFYKSRSLIKSGSRNESRDPAMQPRVTSLLAGGTVAKGQLSDDLEKSRGLGAALFIRWEQLDFAKGEISRKRIGIIPNRRIRKCAGIAQPSLPSW